MIMEEMKKKRLYEALCILAEECGETTQSAMKIIRFGCSDSNVKHLENELGDILCLARYLVHNGYLSQTNIDEAVNAKEDRLKQWSNLFTKEEVS